MKNPECRKDQRVVKCAGAGPDIGETKWSDDTGILRQMRFIVPNETGGAKARVDQEDQEQKHDRAKQTYPPLDNTRFTEGHRLTDGVDVALLSTPRSVWNGRGKGSSHAAKISNPGKSFLRNVGWSLLLVSWQVIR